jgi:hypothetical protein
VVARPPPKGAPSTRRYFGAVVHLWWFATTAQNQEQSKSKTHEGGCAALIKTSVATAPSKGQCVAHEALPTSRSR